MVCSVALTLLFLLPLAHLMALATGSDVRDAEARNAGSKRFQARSYSMIESRHLRTLNPTPKTNNTGLRFREGFLGFLHDQDSRKIY